MSLINPNKLKNEFIEFVTIGRPVPILRINFQSGIHIQNGYIYVSTTNEQFKTYVDRISAWDEFDKYAKNSGSDSDSDSD